MTSSIPFRKYFSNTQSVSTSAFSIPYPNMLLLTTNKYFSSNSSWVEVESGEDYKQAYGSSDGVSDLLDTYFGTINEATQSPKKAVIGRYYNEAVAAFALAPNAPESLATITQLTYPATFDITMGAASTTISVTLSSASSYSEMASLVQTAIRAYTDGSDIFTNATVVYDSDIKRFILTAGTTGLKSTITKLETSGSTDLLTALGGLDVSVVSNGVGSETYSECVKRIYYSNPEAYFYATTETISTDEITSVIDWCQGIVDNQSLRLDIEPVFRFSSKSEAVAIGESLKELQYSGYGLLHDIEDDLTFMFKAIGLFASFGIETKASRMGGNFHSISGVSAINNYDGPINYQQGITNESYVADLDDVYVSYPYTLGVGSQSSLLFGQGATGYDGGTFGSDAAFSILDKMIKVNLANLSISIANFPLRGTAADTLVASALTPAYTAGNNCGLLAEGATLSDTDKAKILNTFGQDAVNALEKQGWYFQVEERTTDDISNKQIRVSDALLDAGSADGGVHLRTVVYR